MKGKHGTRVITLSSRAGSKYKKVPSRKESQKLMEILLYRRTYFVKEKKRVVLHFIAILLKKTITSPFAIHF